MAGAPIIIVGTMTDPEGKTMQVTITGVAASGDLVPSHPIAPGGPPPTVMPPIYYPPTPAHPIVLPPPTVMPPIYYPPVFPAHPIAPGGPPPTVSPPIYYPPYPAHPIVLPPAPPEGGPPTEGGWAYSPVYGWVWVPSGGGGKPKPPDLPVP